MNLLLDTHVFLWLIGDPGRLSSAASEACHDVKNDLYLSAASLWEIQIKSQRGKLKLDAPLSQIVGEETEPNGISLLRIEVDHVLALDQLPPLHQDPFDRMLFRKRESSECVSSALMRRCVPTARPSTCCGEICDDA